MFDHEKLKKLREERKWTQRQVANECELLVSRYQHLESGLYEPNPRELFTISKFFQVDPKEFIEEDAVDTNLYGKELKRRRLNLGMLQGDLAVALGVNKPYISWWESGIKEPNDETKEKIDSIFRKREQDS